MPEQDTNAPEIGAEAARAAFEERWRAALEQPETLPPVTDESTGANTTVEGMLGRLQRIARACVEEELITAEEGDRIAAAADDIRAILDPIDQAKLDEIAQGLR